MSAEFPLPLDKRVVSYADDYGTFQYGIDLPVLDSMRGTLLVVRNIVQGYEASELLDGGDALLPTEVNFYTNAIANIRTEKRYDRLGFGILGVVDAVGIAKYLRLLQETPRNQEVFDGALRRYQDALATNAPKCPEVLVKDVAKWRLIRRWSLQDQWNAYNGRQSLMDADRQRVAESESKRAEAFTAATLILQKFKPYSGSSLN